MSQNLSKDIYQNESSFHKSNIKEEVRNSKHEEKRKNEPLQSRESQNKSQHSNTRKAEGKEAKEDKKDVIEKSNDGD